MKRTYLLLAALVCAVSVPSVAHACKCINDTARGQTLLNDSSVAVARVYVRGTNPKIGQSMLELRETLHGGLSAQNFRAKFATNSCGTIPPNKTEQTYAIKFEKDGTYSIMNSCDSQNVINALSKGN